MRYLIVTLVIALISLKLGMDLHEYLTSLIEAREAAISAALS